MTTAEFQKAMPYVLVYEGGKVDDPHDPGGRTNQGITQNTYNAWRRRQGLPVQDVYLMTKTERNAIYKTQYWDRIKGDELPPGVGFVLFDAAVNSGVAQAARWAQKAASTYADTKIDGDFGSQTVAAIQAINDCDAFVAKFCRLRLGTLQRLKTWSRYGRGWGARIANVQKVGQAWAYGSVGPNPVDVTALGGHAKAPVPDNIVTPPFSTGAAHIATTATLVSTGATQAAQQLGGLGLDTSLTYVKYTLAGLTVVAAGAGLLAMISSNASKAAFLGEREADVDLDADGNGIEVVPHEAEEAPKPVIIADLSLHDHDPAPAEHVEIPVPQPDGVSPAPVKE